MTLPDIENAVASLPGDELDKFRAWFTDFDSNAWDRQIANDMQSGKLDALAEAALRAHQEGGQ